jgi:hypothetical protein
MTDYQEFLIRQKSMLIAPAGYGKTYTISECLKHTEGKQLILTHTHAGIASIKSKLKSAGIASSDYNVETITSFAQKYTIAFCVEIIPDQSDSAAYYSFLIQKATELFKLEPVKRIISASYTGLFVDEYQDCTINQHNLVSVLSEILPTRILGDYLQGIFGFKGEELVNLTDTTQMTGFIDNQHQLDTPWRWNVNGGSPILGENLKAIREALLKNQPIDFTTYTGIEFHKVKEEDLYKPYKDYHKTLSTLLNEPNLLVIHPISNSVNPRVKFLQYFSNRLLLIESIDSKDLYEMAKKLDSLDRKNPLPNLIEIFQNLFVKTSISNWFTDNALKRKQSESDKKSILPVQELLESLHMSFSFTTIEAIFKIVKKLPGVKCYRVDLYYSICASLIEAQINTQTVSVSMQNYRNGIRRMGRSIKGRCIGTTLLTKGLEFETVVLIDAHRFENKEHLYVALTRASKRLVVFANNNQLNPK